MAMNEKDVDINSRLKSVTEKMRTGQFSIALQECKELLDESSPEYRNDILRQRRHIYSYFRDYERALADDQEIIDSGDDSGEVLIGDYYCAAESARNLGCYKQALGLLDQGVILSRDIKSTYFIGALFFFKSFILMKTGKYTRALETLEYVEDDVKMWIDDPCKPLTKEDLISSIKQSLD